MPLIPDQLRWLAEHHPDAIPFEVVDGRAPGSPERAPWARALSAGQWHRDSSRLARGLLARGLATKQVARRLGISPKTCDHHIQRLYGKAGVSTRAGATLFALEHGLVRLD